MVMIMMMMAMIMMMMKIVDENKTHTIGWWGSLRLCNLHLYLLEPIFTRHITIRVWACGIILCRIIMQQTAVLLMLWRGAFTRAAGALTAHSVLKS